MTNSRKRNELLEEIARRRAELLNNAAYGKLADILDGLNAAGFLEDTQQHAPETLLCFGPTTVRGSMPSLWIGSVIWCRPVGYYNYKTLTLLGIWVLEAEPPQVIVGTRALPYSIPGYDPQAYFAMIRKDFTLYYGTDAAPPAEPVQQLYAAPYNPARRLDIRQKIQSTLKQWTHP